jgi:UDPglucose 6-dehydrogenase
MNTITIIGTGYVGLVTGACLSQFGIQVVCMDKDERKIGDLKQGKLLIYESKETARLGFTYKGVGR